MLSDLDDGRQFCNLRALAHQKSMLAMRISAIKKLSLCFVLKSVLSTTSFMVSTTQLDWYLDRRLFSGTFQNELSLRFIEESSRYFSGSTPLTPLFFRLNTVNAAIFNNGFCGWFWPPLTPLYRKNFGHYFNPGLCLATSLDKSQKYSSMTIVM